MMSKLKRKAYVVPFIGKFACYGIRCLLAGSDGTTTTVGISVVCFSMNEKGPEGWRPKASFRLFKSALLHDGYSVCVASLYFCFKLSTSL